MAADGQRMTFTKNIIDFFPNWQNSLQTASWQMIGHALYSTTFDTLNSQDSLLKWIPRCRDIFAKGSTSSKDGKLFLIFRNYLL